MLLLGKWHDYYDSVARSVGVDKQVVYHRETRQIELPPGFDRFKEDLKYGGEVLTSSMLAPEGRFGPAPLIRLVPMLVGFCGEVYPWFYYEVPKPRRERKWIHDTYTGYSNDQDFYWDCTSRIRLVRSRQPHRSRFDRLVEAVGAKSSWLPLFRDVEVPVWILHQPGGPQKTVLTLNPRLEEIEFYRLVDPYTAYQEIYQFVGGVLNQPEREIVDVSDRQLAKAKGFDDWSFRRLPTKKKKGR